MSFEMKTDLQLLYNNNEGEEIGDETIKLLEEATYNLYYSDEELDDLNSERCLRQALTLSERAYDLKPNLESARVAAVSSGRLAELTIMPEKLIYANIFLKYLTIASNLIADKSVKLIAFELFHMKGRLALTIAEMPVSHLTQIEQENTVPKLDLKDAAQNFENAEKINPGELENQFYLAKTYELMQDHDSALMWYHEVYQNEPISRREGVLVKIAKEKIPEKFH